MSISVRSRIPWPPRIRSRERAETQLPRPVPWGSRPAVRTPQPCAVLWQHVEGGRPASAACRLIMARTTRRVNARSAFPRPGHALERVADSRTAPAVGNRDRRRSAHPHDRAVPAGTTPRRLDGTTGATRAVRPGPSACRSSRLARAGARRQPGRPRGRGLGPSDSPATGGRGSTPGSTSRPTPLVRPPSRRWRTGVVPLSQGRRPARQRRPPRAGDATA